MRLLDWAVSMPLRTAYMRILEKGAVRNNFSPPRLRQIDSRLEGSACWTARVLRTVCVCVSHLLIIRFNPIYLKKGIKKPSAPRLAMVFGFRYWWALLLLARRGRV